MPELDVFPVAVWVESRYTLPLPFEVGEYAFPRLRRPHTVHVKEPDPTTGRQNVLVCFQGVSYDAGRSPNFEIDLAKVENFYQKVVLKKKDLKTAAAFQYKSRRYEEVHGDNVLRTTRQIPYEEDVAVYELAVETINQLLLASKVAIKGLSNIPLFDENYFSALYHRDSWFYDFVPEFAKASRIRRHKLPMAIGLPSGFLYVDKQEFRELVLPILRDRKKYTLDEMLVSANKAFGDGEYEASLVLLEAVFEAKVRACVTEYYESRPFKTEATRKDKLNKVMQKGIKELLEEEYPKCEDSKWFCEGVAEYHKWDKLNSQRNKIAHNLHKKGRLSKEDVVSMLDDFDDVFQYLFGMKASYR